MSENYWVLLLVFLPFLVESAMMLFSGKAKN